jgi:hypothetical protein
MVKRTNASIACPRKMATRNPRFNNLDIQLSTKVKTEKFDGQERRTQALPLHDAKVLSSENHIPQGNDLSDR